MATSVCMTLQSYFYSVFLSFYFLATTLCHLVHCIPDLLLLIENLRKSGEWRRIGGICRGSKLKK